MSSNIFILSYCLIYLEAEYHEPLSKITLHFILKRIMTFVLLKQIWIYNQARQMIFNALGVFYKSPFAPRKVSRWYSWLYVDIYCKQSLNLMNQITFKFCWQYFRLQTFCIAFPILHLRYYLFLQSPSANICCTSINVVIINLITSDFRISIMDIMRVLIDIIQTNLCFDPYKIKVFMSHF